MEGQGSWRQFVPRKPDRPTPLLWWRFLCQLHHCAAEALTPVLGHTQLLIQHRILILQLSQDIREDVRHCRPLTHFTTRLSVVFGPSLGLCTEKGFPRSGKNQGETVRVKDDKMDVPCVHAKQRGK